MFVVGNISTLSRLMGLFIRSEAERLANEEECSGWGFHTVAEWEKAEKS